MHRSNNKGFTLIELIIVMAIVAIFVMVFVVELGLAFLVSSKLLVPAIGITGGGALIATVLLTLGLWYALNRLIALALIKSGIKEKIDSFLRLQSKNAK